jgi:nifR3 family TIM-barrel protein
MGQILTLTDTDFFSEIFKKNDLVAAPLASVTNPPFRKILRKFFDGLIFTEMISVEGLKRRIPKTIKYLELSETDFPIMVQLFGSDADSYYDAVQISEEIANPSGYDVNMGCPVRKVLKSGSGSALLKDLKKIDDILRALRKSTNKPLSAKIRLGWDLKNLVFRDIIRICEDNGINALTIHARTKEEMFAGEIHYDLLAEAVSLSSIPIIGNGNVVDKESYLKIKETGVSAVMIGRGMMKAPWIFQSIKKGVKVDEYLNKQDVKKLLYDFFEDEKKFRGEKYYLEVIRKYSVMFSKGLEKSSSFRKKIFSAKDERELKELLDEFYSTNSHP